MLYCADGLIVLTDCLVMHVVAILGAGVAGRGSKT